MQGCISPSSLLRSLAILWCVWSLKLKVCLSFGSLGVYQTLFSLNRTNCLCTQCKVKFSAQLHINLVTDKHTQIVSQELSSSSFHISLLLQTHLEYERGKTVVFTSQSMGGAIASLATLWMLDKQLQPDKPKYVFSITFGFPLVRDEILARAVRCKGWEN